MKRIFISYSRADVIFAQQIAQALREVRADVWIDTEDIPAGEKWSSAIQEGLDTSDVMLVIISPDAMASNNVEDEWQYFMDRGLPVIPVLWQPAKIHFQLHRLQYVDFYRPPFGEAFARLLDELQRKGIDLKVIGAEDTWIQDGIAPERDTDRLPALEIAEPVNPTREDQEAPRTNYVSLLIGIVMMIAVSAALGLPFLIGLNPGDVRYEPPQAGLLLTGVVEVHADATGNSGLFNVIDPVITARFFNQGDVWHRVQGRDETGYQIADFLSDDVGNLDLLRLVPYEVTLPETALTLYTEANNNAPSSRIEAEPTARLYGYTLDENGDEWFRTELYSLTQADTIVGWLPAAAVAFNALDELPVIAKIDETTDGWRDAAQESFALRLRSGTEMRVLDRRDDLIYGGIYQDTAWRLVWVAIEDVTVSQQAITALR